jgi:hypothetical protein
VRFSLASTISVTRVLLKIRIRFQKGFCTDTGDANATKTKIANNTDKKRDFETFILNNERMTSRRSRVYIFNVGLVQ